MMTLSPLSDRGLAEPCGPSPRLWARKAIWERTPPCERDLPFFTVTPTKPGTPVTKCPFQPEPHLPHTPSVGGRDEHKSPLKTHLAMRCVPEQPVQGLVVKTSPGEARLQPLPHRHRVRATITARGPPGTHCSTAKFRGGVVKMDREVALTCVKSSAGAAAFQNTAAHPERVPLSRLHRPLPTLPKVQGVLSFPPASTR